MSESLQKSNAVTFKKTEAVDPSYRYLKISQQTGSTTKTIDANTGAEMVFELPVQCMNLKNIDLVMIMTLTAGAATFYNRFYTGLNPLFTQIQFYNRAGTYLVDNRDSEYINNIIEKTDCTLSEFLTRSDEIWGAHRCDATGLGRYVGTALSPNYTDLEYCVAGAVNTADVFRFKIPMSVLCPSTAFACDRLFYAGEVMLLRFVWNVLANVQFKGTDALDPTTGVAAAAGNIAVSDIQLRIPVCTNQDIVNSIIEKAKSDGGYNMSIPYVHSFRQDLTASTSQTASVRLNRSHGSNLLRVYHSMMLTTQPDIPSKYLSATPTSYYTTLDNERIQQFDLVRANNDDYEYHRTFLQETPIQNVSMYAYNWFHCDSFDGRREVVKRQEVLSKNIICGLSLDREYKYDVVLTTANSAFTHRIHAVCLKNVNVSKSGISVL